MPWSFLLNKWTIISVVVLALFGLWQWERKETRALRAENGHLEAANIEHQRQNRIIKNANAVMAWDAEYNRGRVAELNVAVEKGVAEFQALNEVHENVKEDIAREEARPATPALVAANRGIVRILSAVGSLRASDGGSAGVSDP